MRSDGCGFVMSEPKGSVEVFEVSPGDKMVIGKSVVGCASSIADGGRPGSLDVDK